jgi:hypothetical protein
MSMPYLNPEVWGPQYWFVMHTVALTYPVSPSADTKKQYYEFFMSLPNMLPTRDAARTMHSLLDRYSIAPYLDTRDSLVSWVHQAHNKVNEQLNKPQIDLDEMLRRYHAAYEPRDLKARAGAEWRRKIGYALVLMGLVGLASYVSRE